MRGSWLVAVRLPARWQSARMVPPRPVYAGNCSMSLRPSEAAVPDPTRLRSYARKCGVVEVVPSVPPLFDRCRPAISRSTLGGQYPAVLPARFAVTSRSRLRPPACSSNLTPSATTAVASQSRRTAPSPTQATVFADLLVATAILHQLPHDSHVLTLNVPGLAVPTRTTDAHHRRPRTTGHDHHGQLGQEPANGTPTTLNPGRTTTRLTRGQTSTENSLPALENPRSGTDGKSPRRPLLLIVLRFAQQRPPAWSSERHDLARHHRYVYLRRNRLVLELLNRNARRVVQHRD